jgi:hypothetical protein
MTDLQAYRGQWLANAGGGANVLASADGGRSWRALLGDAARAPCAHGAFALAGARLLAGGDCGEGAFLRAYALAPDGVALASQAPLALQLPPLEGRRVRFIGQAGGQVFAALDGALLRSADGARSFHYVLRAAPDGASFPVIARVLALRHRPQVLLAGGADRATGQAYLAVSRDGGRAWTDISASLPAAGPGAAGPARLTSLLQDRLGRIVLTLNLAPAAQGRLVLLTLTGLD